jgi:DNA polymerase elongation subunit (family B)
VQASFDIETYSHDGGFPDPHEEKCPVIQIATTFQRFGEIEAYKKVLLSLGTCDPIDNVQVIECKTEKQLLEKWTKMIRDEDSDILIGYNIWGFDLHYMYVRAELTNADKFFELGRIIGRKSKHKKASFSSGAYGDSDYEMVDTIGRFQIDLLVIMKREHKLRSYSLNAVAEHFLKDKKVDMPYKEMFRKYKGSSKDRQEIGIYCVKDTDLPLALINKLAILPNLIEMAKATWVPLNFLIERGQGIKVFSLICNTTRDEKMLVVTSNKDRWDCPKCNTSNEIDAIKCNKCSTEKPGEETYTGATVLKALTGAYMDDPITGLDFASLYPTIMRANNLCHSTLVNSEKYDNIPGIEYLESNGFKFVQNPEGILPKLLRTLAQNRKKAKKDMAEAKKNGDMFMYNVYNGKQLAFKVTMNSIYGFTGANVGFLPCKPVASTTTAIGREMIEQTKNLVEEWYPGSTVVYGDSVTGDTALLIRKNNMVETCRIDKLCSVFKTRSDGKEYASLTQPVEVWSDTGFTKIESVIRHKVNKKMYRICTNTGVVDVTEDHSLLLETGVEISPKEMCLDTKLMHHDVKEALQECDTVINDEAALLGEYEIKYVPSVILNASKETKQVFWETYVMTHGMNGIKGKELALGLFAIGSSLGYNLRIKTGTNMSNIFSLEKANNTDATKIKKIISYHDKIEESYVYDLTTRSGHFHVGPGNLIVHNTDSVMVKFDTGGLQGNAAMKKSFELGQEAADKISETFKKPIELEFEKVYCPYLLFSKKRYAGLMYTNYENPDYIDAKGIQLVRRDNCQYVTKVSEKILHMIMYNKSVEKAIEIAQQAAEDLLNYKVTIPDLIVSKSLRRISYVKTKEEIPPGKKSVKCDGFYLTHEYANANQPHLIVACKREEREAGTGPKSGDRVPYVFIDTKNKKDLQYLKAEDPNYAIENQLKPDVVYYLDHGLRSPLESLFELFLDDPTKTLFSNAVKKYEKKKNAQQDIYEFLGI